MIKENGNEETDNEFNGYGNKDKTQLKRQGMPEFTILKKIQVIFEIDKRSGSIVYLWPIKKRKSKSIDNWKNKNNTHY